jgi:hypothetical protein
MSIPRPAPLSLPLPSQSRGKGSSPSAASSSPATSMRIVLPQVNGKTQSLSEQEAAANQLISGILSTKPCDNGDPYALPSHLEAFKQTYEGIMLKQIHLPVIGMLTPRTKKKLSTIPKMNLEETYLIDKKVEEIKSLDPSLALKTLTAVSDAARARLHRNKGVILPPSTVDDVKPKAPPAVSLSGAVEVDKASTEYYAAVERRRIRQEAQRKAITGSLANQRKADLTMKAIGSNEDGHSVRTISRASSNTALHPLRGSFTAPRTADLRDDRLTTTVQSPSKLLASLSPLSSTIPIKLGRLEAAAANDLINIQLSKTLSDAERHNKHKERLNSSYSAFLDKLKCSMLDDYGLNVDETFTRRRKFGKACYTLIYYVNNFKLKTAFDWLKQKVKHLLRQRRIVATMTISYCVKRFLAIRDAKLTKSNLKAQAEARKAARMRNQDRLNLAGALVLGLVRFSVVRKRVSRRKAATTIQSRVRGVLGRTLVANIRAYNYYLFCSARTIQCCYRQHLARRRVSISLEVYS